MILIIDEFGWAKSAGSLEETIWVAKRKAGASAPETRCTGETTNFLFCVMNASQHGRDLTAQRVTLCCARHEKLQNLL